MTMSPKNSRYQHSLDIWISKVNCLHRYCLRTLHKNRSFFKSSKISSSQVSHHPRLFVWFLLISTWNTHAFSNSCPRPISSFGLPAVESQMMPIDRTGTVLYASAWDPTRQQHDATSFTDGHANGGVTVVDASTTVLTTSKILEWDPDVPAAGTYPSKRDWSFSKKNSSVRPAVVVATSSSYY